MGGKRIPKEIREEVLAKTPAGEKGTALAEINKLKQCCYGKDYIEIGDNFKSIKILQLTKEVKKLQKLLEKAGIRGIEREEVVSIHKTNPGYGLQLYKLP